MKKILVFLVILFSAVPVWCNEYKYKAVTGKNVVDISYSITRSTFGYIISAKSVAEDNTVSQTLYVDNEYNTISYSYKDPENKVVFDGIRENNTVKLSGEFKGKNITAEEWKEREAEERRMEFSTLNISKPSHST